MTARRLLPRPPLIGLRGAFLLDIAVAWFGVALLAWVNPGAPEAGGDFFSAIPAPLYAGLWAAAGIVAVVSAFRRSPRSDKWGFILAAFFATFRAGAYGWAWAGLGGPSDGLGWFGLLTWGAIAWAIMTASKVEDAGPPREESP